MGARMVEYKPRFCNTGHGQLVLFSINLVILTIASGRWRRG